MICVRCGKEIKKDQLFCPNCGYEIKLVAEYDALDDLIVNPNIDFIDEDSKSVNIIKDKQIAKKGFLQYARNKKIFYIVLTAFILCIVSLWSIISFRNNNSFDYQIYKANKYKEQGKYKIAMKYALRATELSKKNIAARLLVADISYESNDYISAIKAYNEAISINPSKIEAYDGIIKTLKHEKKYSEIKDIIDSSKIKARLSEKYSEFYPSMPKLKLPAGEYADRISLDLSSDKKGDIFYTVNGATPTKLSAKYSTPIVLAEESYYVIKAIFVNEYGVSSDVMVASYNIRYPIPSAPLVTPSTGKYDLDTLIKVVTDEDCAAYYNWDGKVPDEKALKYSLPLKMKEGSHTFTVVSINKYGKVSAPTFRSFDASHTDEDPEE